jgi:hypothetical protein
MRVVASRLRRPLHSVPLCLGIYMSARLTAYVLLSELWHLDQCLCTSTHTPSGRQGSSVIMTPLSYCALIPGSRLWSWSHLCWNTRPGMTHIHTGCEMHSDGEAVVATIDGRDGSWSTPYPPHHNLTEAYPGDSPQRHLAAAGD